ncbi:MAG: Calx-beta domain-containing protein, partial [Verrucomicrobiia bacterium]
MIEVNLITPPKTSVRTEDEQDADNRQSARLACRAVIRVALGLSLLGSWCIMTAVAGDGFGGASIADPPAGATTVVAPSGVGSHVQQVCTFYSLQHPEYPPMPFNPFPDLPDYSAGDNVRVYDDRSVDYVQLQMEAEADALALAAEKALLDAASGAGGQRTMSQGNPPLSILIAKNATNTFATLTVTNCIYGHRYLVLNKTNLNNTNWNSEFYFTAPSDQVKTFTVPTLLPMKFFEAVELTATNAIVSIQRGGDAVEPPGPGNQAGWFLVNRAVADGTTLPPLTVCYTIGGTASNGVDCVVLSGAVAFDQGETLKLIDVTPYQDSITEWDETVTLTLRPTNSYFLDPLNTAATVWIFDTASVTQQFAKVIHCATPVGVDFNPYTNSLIASYNWWTLGYPLNFTNYTATGSGTPWTGIHGLGSDVCPELHFTTVKLSTNNFVAGSMYFGIGPDAQHPYTRIGWASRDAGTSNLSWATLTNGTAQEARPVTGALNVDQTGLFDYDLIVVTGDGTAGEQRGGNVWRVKAPTGGASGSRTLFASISGGPSLEGVITLPNNPQKYGPLAGKIITSSKWTEPPFLYAIDTNHNIAVLPVDIVYPEDLDLI